MPNLYEILEIKHNASLSDIKQAYHKLALRFHPDKNPTDEATTQFQKIAFAYETLSDTFKRQTYDNCLKNNDTEQYDKGNASTDFSFASFFNADYFSSYVDHIKEEMAEYKRKATNRINEVFSSFSSMSEEQKSTVLQENRGILLELYYGTEPAEYSRVIHLYPITELIEELKGPQSPLRRLLGDFQPNRCHALLTRLSPNQRWNILQELDDGSDGFILYRLIERHQEGYYSDDFYKYGDHDIFTTMVLLPKLYFNELDQYIEALEATSEVNALKLANALSVLRVDLEQEVTRQEENQKSPAEIQSSQAMQTLRETLLMVSAVRSMPASEAIEAINRYEQYCSSKSSVIPRVIETVIFAAIGLVTGALIGLLISASMGLGALPLTIVGAALSGSAISAGISAINGTNSALSKHGLFRPKLEIDEDNVVQSAHEYKKQL